MTHITALTVGYFTGWAVTVSLASAFLMGSAMYWAVTMCHPVTSLLEAKRDKLRVEKEEIERRMDREHAAFLTGLKDTP